MKTFNLVQTLSSLYKQKITVAAETNFILVVKHREHQMLYGDSAYLVMDKWTVCYPADPTLHLLKLFK